MATQAELLAIMAKAEKDKADARKKLAEKKRLAKIMLTKIGHLVSANIWSAPESVQNWVRAEIRKLAEPTTDRRGQKVEASLKIIKQSQDMLTALDDQAAEMIAAKNAAASKAVAKAEKAAAKAAPGSSDRKPLLDSIQITTASPSIKKV